VFLWRNLPKGQLTAVLEWVVSRRRRRPHGQETGQEAGRFTAAPPPTDAKTRRVNSVYPLQSAKAGAGQGPRK